MSVKPVIPRALANQDVAEAIAYCLAEGTEQAALDFISALEVAFDRIGRHAGAGTPGYAHEVDIPGLRCWPVGRFPYLVFYIERQDHIDVWRVLHGRRDIPVWMQESEGGTG